MKSIPMVAAWVIPLFAGATGGLLFGYLGFLRWSQEGERRAADGESAAHRIDLQQSQHLSDQRRRPLQVAGSGVA